MKHFKEITQIVAGPIIGEVADEMDRALDKHPNWPKDKFIALSIVSEELGEAHQALLQATFENKNINFVREEMIQVIVSAFRFIKHFDEGAK